MIGKTDLNISLVIITGTFSEFKIIINTLKRYSGQIIVKCIKIDVHIGFANLASFHHMDFPGLLVCHSRELAEMNCSDFVFVAICLGLTPKLK